MHNFPVIAQAYPVGYLYLSGYGYHDQAIGHIDWLNGQAFLHFGKPVDRYGDLDLLNGIGKHFYRFEITVGGNI